MTRQQEQFINDTAAWVRSELKDAEAGHDWFHIERVWTNTRLILESEPADQFIAQLGALLHDIADAKFHNGDDEIGPQKTREYLYRSGIDEETSMFVENIVRHISFKGGNTERTFHSAELAVVQDADRLDAMGAIGIARAFHYGGFKNRLLFDPSCPPDLAMSAEAYRKSSAPTINHFYEKLLLLKDRMNTATGRALAEERHRFMEAFLDQFYEEWFGGKGRPNS